MVFSRQEYWSGLPSPPLRDLPNPGIEPGSPEKQADFVFTAELPGNTSLMIDVLIELKHSKISWEERALIWDHKQVFYLPF